MSDCPVREIPDHVREDLVSYVELFDRHRMIEQDLNAIKVRVLNWAREHGGLREVFLVLVSDNLAVEVVTKRVDFYDVDNPAYEITLNVRRVL